jgi:hypothetical protein
LEVNRGNDQQRKMVYFHHQAAKLKPMQEADRATEFAASFRLHRRAGG